MTATPLQHAEWTYDHAAKLTARRLPYVFGGGHGVAAVKPEGIPPTNGGVAGGPVGLDCSGAASACLWYGGLLDHQEALATPELEAWGTAGPGQYLTLRVLDIEGVIHHCFLEFHLPAPRTRRYFMAAVPGTIVGWFELDPTWVAGFHTRHA